MGLRQSGFRRFLVHRDRPESRPDSVELVAPELRAQTLLLLNVPSRFANGLHDRAARAACAGKLDHGLFRRRLGEIEPPINGAQDRLAHDSRFRVGIIALDTESLKIRMLPPRPISRSPRVAEEHTLVLTACNAGFFSHVNRVVNHLHHSLGRGGCAAVRVDWRVGDDMPLFVYGTEQNGELWQHFFEPLAFPNAPHAERRTWKYADLSMTGLHAYQMYKRGSRWRIAYGRTFAEHVRVREELRRRSRLLWQDGGAGERCVGVHYRHPEHAHECPRPVPPIEVFIEQARRLLRTRRRASVVLATDVHEAVESFRATFGDRLLVQPGIARAHAAGHQDNRDVPPSVALGEQALIDALLLARCETMLHPVSNLPTAVGYMNPGLKMVYCEPRLLGAIETVRARISRPRPATDEGISRRAPATN